MLNSYYDTSPPRSRSSGTTHAVRGSPRQVAARELMRKPARPALGSDPSCRTRRKVESMAVLRSKRTISPESLRRGSPVLGHLHARGARNSGRFQTSFLGGSHADDTRVLVVPSSTDNRGNGAALCKLMSTRFPSSAVLMELATYMKGRGMRTIVEWALQEFHKEADQLANGLLAFVEYLA